MIHTDTPSVAYYAISEHQLQEIINESVKATLKEVGFDFDTMGQHLATEQKDEYKPLAYWLNKLNINRSTLWRRAKENLITPSRMGGKVYLCQRDIDQMFQKLAEKR